MKTLHFGIGGALALMLAGVPAFANAQQWPADKADAWYAGQRWLIGSNFIPADTINQIEMWQADTPIRS